MMFFINNEPVQYDVYQLDISGNLTKKSPIFTYWWDDVPNFGDWIGPYLLSKITDRPLINTKGSKRENVLFTVGSILEHIDKDFDKAEVWGSGLIQAPHKKRIKKLNKHIHKIHAVRGELTYSELVKNTTLNVPKIFGDPALLMPMFYEPKKSLNEKKISVCPHFSHYNLFSVLNESNALEVIDVSDNLQTVVDQIVNSKVCISSSLHGLIIAQAYGVPWVWLDLPEKSLDGHSFKFEDFFSTLKQREKVCKVSLVSNEINENRLIELANLARLNDLKYSPNLLYESFPFY